MKIEGKLACDIVGVHSKVTPKGEKENGKRIYVDLEIGIDQGTVNDRWGEDMAVLAFSTMRRKAGGTADGESLVYLVNRLTPNKRRVVFELHKVEFPDQAVEAQPSLQSVRLVEGSTKAVAKIRVPLEGLRAKLAANLLLQTGEMIDVAFAPLNRSLPFADGPNTEAPEAAAGKGKKAGKARGKLRAVKGGRGEAHAAE